MIFSLSFQTQIPWEKCVKILHDNSSDRLHALPKIDITMQMVTSRIHSLLSYKKEPPTQLRSAEKVSFISIDFWSQILLSAAFRDESQVCAFKMGDLLHSAIEFMIDHWIALAIGLLVLLIHRYVCTMQQNVSSKIIHETPRWVKEKINCVVFVLGSQSDPLRLFSRVTVGFELELSLM